MSAQYSILSQTQLNKWDDRLQEAVEGWQIKALWAASAAVVTVFVPQTVYDGPTATTEIDSRIRQAGYKTEQVAALGKAAPPAES